MFHSSKALTDAKAEQADDVRALREKYVSRGVQCCDNLLVGFAFHHHLVALETKVYETLSLGIFKL